MYLVNSNNGYSGEIAKLKQNLLGTSTRYKKN